VAVLDRAAFPRVKLCGGWLSPPVWDVLELLPRSYPGGLWAWQRCHVQYEGELHTVPAQGFFIRRWEFDEFLLRRSGAESVEHAVKHIERRDEEWVVDEKFAARFLIGAGGTNCPVARQLFPPRTDTPVGAQEHEFVAGAERVAAARAGHDGEPELLLHADFSGYSWNVPKGAWQNVGTGTSEPRAVRAAFADARRIFSAAGHLPEGTLAALEAAKGHTYHLFHASHLANCEREGALLVGDALGLAHPLTAEGILPALISGRLAAEAISLRDPKRYPTLMEQHPVLVDYALARDLLTLGLSLRERLGGVHSSIRLPRAITRFSQARIARGFAHLFSGGKLPYSSQLRTGLAHARKLSGAPRT